MGFQNSATGLVLGFYAARSYSLMRPPRAGWRLIRSWERSATWVVGSGRLQLEAAVESPSDVVGLVPARITRKCRWPSDFTALAAFLPLRDIPSATRTQPAPALGRSGSSRSMPPQKDSTPAWHLRVTPWPGALRSVQTEAGTGRREVNCAPGLRQRQATSQEENSDENQERAHFRRGGGRIGAGVLASMNAAFGVIDAEDVEIVRGTIEFPSGTRHRTQNGRHPSRLQHLKSVVLRHNATAVVEACSARPRGFPARCAPR